MKIWIKQQFSICTCFNEWLRRYLNEEGRYINRMFLTISLFYHSCEADIQVSFMVIHYWEANGCVKSLQQVSDEIARAYLAAVRLFALTLVRHFALICIRILRLVSISPMGNLFNMRFNHSIVTYELNSSILSFKVIK